MGDEGRFDKQAVEKKIEYVNTETGEVKEKTLIYYRDRKIDERRNRFLYEEKKVPARLFQDRFYREFKDKLTEIELGRLLRLFAYVKEGNMLLKRGTEGMIPLDREDISKILSLKERTTREYLNKLIKEKLILKVEYCEEKIFIVNPTYFMYGKWLNECVAYAFKREIKDTMINDREKALFNKYILNIKNKPKKVR